MPAIRAVVFDLGGTLWEYRPGLTVEGVLSTVAPGAIALLAPDQAATVTPMQLAVAVRRAYLDLEHEAQDGDPKPVPAELCVTRGLASLGIETDAATARAMLAALYVSETRTSRLLPGADELLPALVGAGLRLGIISNRMYGGDLLLNDLDYFGISHYFSSLVASCDLGFMKPHPALYRRALDELGVSSDEAVMVGDDLRADVGGSLAAGLRAIWVRRPPTRTDEPPPGVPSVAALDEVLPALQRLQVP